MNKVEMKKIERNYNVTNALTPISGMTFKKTGFRMGDVFCQVFSLVRYPYKPKVGWLEEILSIPNTISNITITPTDNTELITNISKGKTQNEIKYSATRDELERQRTEREIVDAEEIIRQMDLYGETVVYVTISIMVIAETEEEVRQTGKIVLNKLKAQGIDGKQLTNLSKKAFKEMSPFSVSNEEIKRICARNMTSSSWIGGYPFSRSGFNDGKGYYFGRDVKEGIIILDSWKRGGDRTNSNFVITGTAGVGKSTVTKHIGINEYMIGSTVIFIDPEREYKEMTENLGGNWIDIGSGKGGRINPLQIREIPLEDEDLESINNSGKGMGAMALHFQTLRTFFMTLFPELTALQMAVLEEVLEELYNNFNIYWDTNIENIPNDKFPILTDLYELLEKKIQNCKNEEREQVFNELKSLFRSICVGADSQLFNGHTTIEFDSQVICFDTFNLQNASDKVKKAQYFNALVLCWEIMSKDKEQKTMLICDESYLLFDPQIIQMACFVRNMAKRCRKYEGSLVLVTHSIVDFLDPSIKIYGQAVLDQASNKILMGTDGQNLEEERVLFKLSDSEVEFISRKKRGTALSIIGTNRIFTNFKIFPEELRHFGKGGGR